MNAQTVKSTEANLLQNNLATRQITGGRNELQVGGEGHKFFNADLINRKGGKPYLNKDEVSYW